MTVETYRREHYSAGAAPAVKVTPVAAGGQEVHGVGREIMITGPASDPAQIGIGVIGYGYWGPNLVRNFSEAPGSRVIGVSDLNPQRLEHVQARYPWINITSNCDDL